MGVGAGGGATRLRLRTRARGLAPDPATSPIENRIVAVLVPVTDVERARAWYCALLDVAEPPIVDGRANLNMQGVTLTLTPGAGAVRPEEPAIAFRAEDMAAARAFLTKHGIRTLDAGDGDRRLRFRDPDGNTLMVCGPGG